MRISPHTPFSPARWPFFYGWVIVLMSIFGASMSLPGQTAGFSAFTQHLLAVLTIDRVTLSAAYMSGTIASSLLLPFAGRIYDRVGARVMVVVSALGLGGTLWYLSFCDAISSGLAGLFGSADGTLATVQFIVLVLGFFGARFWGQGVLTMVSRAMVGKWFKRRRGLAVGLSAIVTSVFFSFAPVILATLIGSWGWRGAWRNFGLFLIIVVATLGFLFYRDNPEECGLRMDGDRAPEVDATSASVEDEINFTLGEALGTYAFWIFNAALSLPALTFTAMTFHIVDIGARSGLSETESLALFRPMVLFNIIANIGFTAVSDRVRAKYLVWAMLVFQALACTGLIHIESQLGRWLMVAGFGASGGLFALLVGLLWPRFYGRAHLGSISGVNMSVVVFASAIGPWLFAVAQEVGHDYAFAYIGCAALALVVLVAALEIRNPQRATGNSESPPKDKVV